MTASKIREQNQCTRMKIVNLGAPTSNTLYLFLIPACVPYPASTLRLRGSNVQAALLWQLSEPPLMPLERTDGATKLIPLFMDADASDPAYRNIRDAKDGPLRLARSRSTLPHGSKRANGERRLTISCAT